MGCGDDDSGGNFNNQNNNNTAGVCGNDIMEAGEDCDGTDTGPSTCASLGPAERVTVKEPLSKP
jgi:hypothetical protein